MKLLLTLFVLTFLLWTNVSAHEITDIAKISKWLKKKEPDLKNSIATSFQTHRKHDNITYDIHCEPTVVDSTCKGVSLTMDQALTRLENVIMPRKPIKIKVIVSKDLCEVLERDEECHVIAGAAPYNLAVLKLPDLLQSKLPKPKFPVPHTLDSFNPNRVGQLVVPISLARQMELVDKNQEKIQNVQPSNGYDIIVVVNARQPFWFPNSSSSKADKFDFEGVILHELLVSYFLRVPIFNV